MDALQLGVEFELGLEFELRLRLRLDLDLDLNLDLDLDLDLGLHLRPKLGPRLALDRPWPFHFNWNSMLVSETRTHFLP